MDCVNTFLHAVFGSVFSSALIAVKGSPLGTDATREIAPRRADARGSCSRRVLRRESQPVCRRRCCRVDESFACSPILNRMMPVFWAKDNLWIGGNSPPRRGGAEMDGDSAAPDGAWWINARTHGSSHGLASFAATRLGAVESDGKYFGRAAARPYR